MANKIAFSTSNSGKIWDPSPQIRAAGKCLTDPNDSVEACVKHGVRPVTPPNVKPFRKSYTEEPGRITTHYGKAFDPPPPDMRFGQANSYTDHAKDLIHPLQESAFTEKRRLLKESFYHSHRKEPIGKPATLGVVLPEISQDSKFRFGKSTSKSESAKNLIYPVNDPYDDNDAIHQMYVATHGRYEAGEQKNRGYDWAAHGIDPTNFRFGMLASEVKETDGAAKALKPDMVKAYGTIIVKKAVEDFRDVSRDELGQPKNMGFGNRELPKGFTFGRANRPDEWDARQCIQGDYPTECIRPDADLGRSRTLVKKPVVVPNDKVFGVPTIRSDIPRPKHKRVTDFQNYGDEAKADGVMYPSKYSDLNVYEDDFLHTISKERMLELLLTMPSFNLDEQSFEAAWSQAQQFSDNGSVCVESFRRAVEMLGL